MEKEASLYQRAKKGVKAAALVGLTALGLSGCAKNNLYGNFKGYDVIVSLAEKSHKASGIIIYQSGLLTRTDLIATSTNSDGFFDKIRVDNLKIEDWKKFLSEGIADSSNSYLIRYANQDSLNRVYNEVLRQNGRAAAVSQYHASKIPSDSSSSIDTIALRERIAGDEYLLENQVAQLRSAAAENNPNGLAVIVLKPYLAVEQDISRRIEAREDTLRKARGSQ